MRREDETLSADQARKQAGVNSGAIPASDVAYGLVTESMSDDSRDRLDELRQRIRSGDLSHAERDQLDQLVFVVAVAERRAATAAREYPGEVAVQRALAAEAWSRVAGQLRVILGQAVGR